MSVSSDGPRLPLPSTELLESMGFVRIVEADREAGTVVAEFDVQPRFCHTHGTVAQGGFVTAWLDFAMAHAALLRAGHRVDIASLELKVSFLQRVGPGRVLARGRVERMGRRVAFLEATLTGRGGAVLAKATSSALVLPTPG